MTGTFLSPLSPRLPSPPMRQFSSPGGFVWEDRIMSGSGAGRASTDDCLVYQLCRSISTSVWPGKACTTAVVHPSRLPWVIPWSKERQSHGMVELFIHLFWCCLAGFSWGPGAGFGGCKKAAWQGQQAADGRRQPCCAASSVCPPQLSESSPARYSTLKFRVFIV